ncbi:Thioesterase-like superfamily protein [Sphingomonas guangdongensis]|uniref:Thioesterase-like superfamily protein n=1 Tax=Sphingomonas guangdongensis TaxID=1141890 RepID=A0A285R1W3_9SPHN|nr:thioesterase family protein [Sphingomonas guangdongensis]SOB87758.1 Thioesterase-like superfamily protein [Sphingomonas guangdongensis]
MTSVAGFLAAAVQDDHGWSATIPADWLQGRTAFGGLSTALALQVAKASEADLPPLRSALVAFVGPLAGVVKARARRLRRGRNAAFVEVEISSEAGLGYRATFVFMADLGGNLAHDTLPPATDPLPIETGHGPDGHFTRNLEFGPSAPMAAGWRRWVRLNEWRGLDAEVAVMTIADALPPAAFRLNRGASAMSSLTWMVNLLHPAPTTHDGWWLMETRTERAVAGHSSQHMTLWNAGGVPVVHAMQAVAIFG